MNLNCLIIDDESLAIDVIKTHIERIPFLSLIATTTSAFEAIEIIESQHIDLLFLDIQMPELTGLELLNSLDKKPFVIFTTAYPDYALQSYELDAVDYLVKPIPFDRLLKAVNKAKKRIAPKEAIEQVVVADGASDFIFVKTEYKTVRINLSDIYYIESMKDYVTFHLGNERIRSLLSIKNVEENLPINRFVRIHRSFIVAPDKIDEIERNTILINGNRLTVGTNYREVFKGIINKSRVS